MINCCICISQWFTLAAGHFIVLDSGLCALKAVIALNMKSIFAAALIEKCRFGLTYIPDQHVIEQSQEKSVWMVDAISRALESIKCTICSIKEPDYVMQIMATGGALCTMGGRCQAYLFCEWREWITSFNMPSHLNITSISAMLWMTTPSHDT